MFKTFLLLFHFNTYTKIICSIFRIGPCLDMFYYKNDIKWKESTA